MNTPIRYKTRVVIPLLATAMLAVTGTALAGTITDTPSDQAVEQQTLERNESRMSYDNETEQQSANRAAETRDNNYGRDDNDIEPSAPSTGDVSVPGSEDGTTNGDDFQQ